MWYRAIWKDDGWALMTVYFVLEIQLKMALMKVDVSTTAFILTFISTLQCNAWLLLSASLVHQFAKINNRFSIVFHLPSHDNDNIIHAYRKMFRYNWGGWTKEVGVCAELRGTLVRALWRVNRKIVKIYYTKRSNFLYNSMVRART